MASRPEWDNQFAETEDERSARMANRRGRTIIDARDPDRSRSGIFVWHNCSRCNSGEKPCIVGNPRHCEYPHARND